MSRHFRQACDRAAGFSFVELLVTIIIAGIAFAAMVPLFVQAQQKNSADNVRNISLQIAQDKIEKIRQLSYEEITEASLESTATAGGQFGPSWDFRLASGATRTFTIAYQVDPVPLNAAPGQEKFKQITVTVRWSAPPTPVKDVVLVTRVYKQNAGPDIITANVGPPEVFEEDPADVFTIVGSPVVIDVYISPDDIASMDAFNVDPTKRGWVKFAVGPYSGTAIDSADVNAVYNNEAGHYQFVWENSGVPDDIYRVEATAFSKAAIQGSSVSIAYNVALTNPPAPTGLVAQPGDKLVSLTWDTSAIGDLDYYEVWRGTAAGGETRLADTGDITSYTDTAVDNGTTYYYVVRVVDTDGNESSFSAEVSATPAVQADTTPPTTPTGFTAVKLPLAPTVNLAWTPSADPGSPATGVLGYIIERSTDGGAHWTQIEGTYPNFMYPDSGAGWGATLYYRVAAIDNVGLVSGYAQAGPVVTDAQPKYSLTVANTKSVGIYVWVQNVGTGQWYSTGGVAQGTKPAGTNIKKNKSVIWSQLPSGIYNVFASTSTSGTPPLTSQSGSGDLSSGNNTIRF
jgi:fibronectin type 3 domain-containing protein/type II secretory pathway pseudopilin PulG